MLRQEAGSRPINRHQLAPLEGKMVAIRRMRGLRETATTAAALHLDVVEEESGFTLDYGLKEGPSALAGGGALW